MPQSYGAVRFPHSARARLLVGRFEWENLGENLLQTVGLPLYPLDFEAQPAYVNPKVGAA